MASRMIDEDEHGGRHLQKAKVSLQDFDDIDPTTFMREEDFDDIDDFEKQIDFDGDMQTDEKFKNELLFAVQGLGSTKKQYDLEFYMKGPHCEDALKDIIRFCKRDDDDFPITRIELGKWEVLQKDLLQLLTSQVQDKKLTFYLLMLFTQLTEFPKKSCTRRNELIGYLQNYKFAFGTNSNVIHTINIHLSDFFQVEEDERPKIYDQMIEMIVIIYKNLLKVPDNNTPDGFISQRRDLQPKFITTLYRQKTLDAFVFIVQQASPVLMKKLNLYLLEIFYHLFSSFEPVWLFQKTEQDKNLIQQIRDKEKRDRMQRLSEMSTRHARFDCNIKVVRTFNSGSKIIHNPFKNDWNDNSFPNSTKKPKARKFHEKNASIFPNSHDKEVIVSNIIDENEQQGSLKQIIRELSVDFVEHAFDKLIETLYEEIHNNPARIEEEDRIYFFFIMAYGLEVFRHHFYSRKENRENQANEEEYSIASVGAALQLTVFELVQSTIMKQVSCAKKSDFSPRLFHSSLYSFLQLLYCVREMRLTVNQIARKSGQILMQKIFTQDNARMLRKGFDYYKPDVHDPKLGKTLAEFIGVFFDLLDEYSKGKVLKIQTNKVLHRNKAKEKKQRERLKIRERKLREREQKLKQKIKDKAKKRKEKERAKAKKDKKKKKKKDLRIPRGEEDQDEIQRNYEAEVKKFMQEKNNEAQEENEFTGEPQQTLEQEVPATVGTEYTVGSTLQSDFLQTLDDQQGGTMETMPTLQPAAATFEPTLAEQPGNYLENTLAPEEVPASTLLIEQTLAIADTMEEEQPRVIMEEEGVTIATKEVEQHEGETEKEEILQRKEDNDNDDDDDDNENEDAEAGDEDKSKDSEQDSEEDEKLTESEMEDIEGEGIPEDLEEEEEDDGSDSGSEEGVKQYHERIVNFASELAYMADYQVVSVLLNMIRADKLESNNQKINNAVASFMRKIVTVLKADWLFFQIDFLLIFQDILNIQNPKIRVQNQPLFEIINVIVKNFFVLFRKNKLLSVECLFRFADRMTLKTILANYAEPDIEKEAQEDPTPGGDIGDDWNYRRGTGSLWDEKSDMVLIQNYEDYQDLPDCEAQLCLLFNKMNMNDFSIKDIKRRVKFLRLEKGKMKAQEVFNNIYKDSIRMTIEQALAHSIQLIDPSKFTKDDLVAFLVSVLEQYIDYKQFIGQSIENLHNVDMAVIPLQKKDFDLLEWECIHTIFTSMNFREPRQGESYWRVPGFITINEAQILIDKLRGPSTIESTVPIDEENYATIQSTVPVEQDEENYGNVQSTMPIDATVPATVPVDQDEENYGNIQSTMPIDATIPATVPVDQEEDGDKDNDHDKNGNDNYATVPIDDDYDDIPSRNQTQNADMELDPMGLLGKNKYADDDTGEVEYD